jgi:hypothetical protein
VIKAPRQLGKSSLLKRYLFECRRLGKQTALVDLSLFSDQELSDYAIFLTSLAIELMDRLDLESEAPPTITSQPEMSRFVRRQLLGSVQGLLVVAFDEVDRVLGRPYQSDFFSMLRYWHECRADTTSIEWARLELALVISTEPYLLVQDASRSPFNVRDPITLECFTLDECTELNRKHGSFLADQEVLQLHGLLNGHPYLTRLAYYWLAGPRKVDFSTLLRTAHRDDGPFGDHLRAVMAKLKRHQPEGLIAVLRKVLTDGTVPNDDIYYRLRGAGLVQKRDGRVALANQLYERFFGGMS